MSPQKKNPSSFRSIRIIGKHAQKIFETAKERIQSASEQTKESSDTLEQLPAQEPQSVLVSVSTASVVRATFSIVAILLLMLVLYQIQHTILLLLLAVFLSVIIDPGVAFLERLHIPRAFAVILVYIAFFGLLMFLLISLIPIIASQIQQMAARIGLFIDAFLLDPQLHLPILSEKLNEYVNAFSRQVLVEISTGGSLDMMQQMGQRLSVAAQGSLAFFVNFAGSLLLFIADLVVVLTLAFFLQLEKESVQKWLRSFLPYHVRRYAEGKLDAIYIKLAQWIHGQLLLSLVIGILVFTALTILRMPYALTLAVLAAFTEFIPVLGPIIAAIPAIFIAVVQVGFIPALVVGLVYYGIQWCENNLLVPIIMNRAVGLSPIAIMVALLVGVSFPEMIHPILGVLICVPVATIIAIFLQDVANNRKK